MRKRLQNSLIATVITASLVLAGCGSGNGDGDLSEEKKESGSQTTESGIRVSTSANSGRPGLEAIAPKFEEETGIKVTTEFGDLGTDAYTSELMTQLQGGSAPDVFAAFAGTGTSSPNVGTLAEAGSLMDLSDLEFAKNVKGTPLENAVTIDGRVYAACLGVQTSGIIYNEDLFTEYKLTIPETWDELLALVAKIREVAPDKTPIAFGGGNTSIAMINTSMLALNQPSFTGEEGGDNKFVDSEAWKGALQMLEELVKANAFNQSVSTDGSNEIVAMMAAGDAFMCIDLSSRFAAIKRADADCPIKFCTLPARNKEDSTMLLWPGTMATVYAETQNKDGAVKFMEYITGEEGNNMWIEAAGGSELSVSNFTDASKWEGCFKDQADMADKSVMIPCVTWPSAGASNALGEGVAGILADVQGPDEVLAAMDAGWTK